MIQDQDLIELREMLGEQMFFEPDNNFIDWLVGYAGDRIIIDCGCGRGHVTEAINDRGGKAIGIDPFMTDRLRMKAPSVFYRSTVEESVFDSLPGDKVLYLLARPCHGLFTESIVHYAQPNSEVLYVGLYENIKIDFQITDNYQAVTEAPACAGYEIAVSIKK